MFANSEELLKYLKDESVEMVDVRFCDLPGVMQHFSVPVSSFDQSVFDDGLGFDGSSIRGFQAINESDMLLVPGPDDRLHGPFTPPTDAVVNFFIEDPLTRQPYAEDPRYTAIKAEQYLKTTGIGDTVFFGPEAEFFVFDKVLFENGRTPATTRSTPRRRSGTAGRRDATPASRSSPRAATSRPAPTDNFSDLRSEMVIEMVEPGIDVEMPTTRSASAGQCEIDMKFDTLVKMADQVMSYKYIVKQTAPGDGYIATFMPKPIFGDNGSGMHVHQSIWKNGEPTFFDETGLRGLVRHRPLVHRRPAQARPVAAGVLRADDELLPPAGAGLRGSDQPDVLGPQPLGLRPHPDGRQVAEVQARRVPRPGPHGEPLPGVLRADDGRHRRHPEPHRAAEAPRQGPLRAAAIETPGIEQTPGSLRARSTTSRTTTSSS